MQIQNIDMACQPPPAGRSNGSSRKLWQLSRCLLTTMDCFVERDFLLVGGLFWGGNLFCGMWAARYLNNFQNHFFMSIVQYLCEPTQNDIRIQWFIFSITICFLAFAASRIPRTSPWSHRRKPGRWIENLILLIWTRFIENFFVWLKTLDFLTNYYLVANSVSWKVVPGISKMLNSIMNELSETFMKENLKICPENVVFCTSALLW